MSNQPIPAQHQKRQPGWESKMVPPPDSSGGGYRAAGKLREQVAVISGLMDYAATKGAIVAFTRSLASALADRGIRVNAVAPAPIWTPLIPASFAAEEAQTAARLSAREAVSR